MRHPKHEQGPADRERLSRFQELGRALLRAESTEAVAESAVRHIRDVVPCSHLSVVVFDEAADQATVMAAFSAGQTKGAGGSRWRRDAFGTPEEFRAGRAFVVDDLQKHTPLSPGVAALGREGIRALITVGLVAEEETIGVILAGSASPGAFKQDEAEALIDAAEILALAVKRGRRVEALLGHAVELERRVADLERSGAEHRALLTQIGIAQEQERHRIAGDIHDDSVQVMTTAVMRLQVLRAAIDDERLVGLVDQLEDTVRHAIKRLRHLMFELIPPALDREGLGPALTLYLAKIREEAGLGYRLENRVRTQPPAEARAILYRIAQEAVTNVVKHARARSVQVVVEERDGGFVVRITDDGVGFSIDEIETRLPMHLGLTAMRQRAEMGGGWCRVRSIRGSGTTVEAWVPDDRAVMLPESEISAARA
jgi:signal transduction histidine kinase